MEFSVPHGSSSCCCSVTHFVSCVFTCQSLLEVHDAIAFKTYASPPASPGPNDEAGTLNGFGGQPIRMVGLHKQPNKPLVSFCQLDNGY